MSMNRVAVVVTCMAMLSLAARFGPPFLRSFQPEDAKHFGSVHFPISCSPKAQRDFDRAVAMLHSFFNEAEDEFAAIAKAEPSCAMAYWGVAISQRPNPLAAPFGRAALKRGFEAIEKGKAATQATPRERAWIESLAAFFHNFEVVDQTTRTADYEVSMARLHDRYPDDVEAAIFYALALNEAVDPSDQTYARQLKAAKILEELEPRHPDHPGIPHYIIHSYDYPALANLGLFAAVRCSQIASSAPHALHMPSHIFAMLGMWADVVRTDLAADAAVKAQMLGWNPQAGTVQADNAGRYHSLDFLTAAYLQLAQDRRAKEIVDARNSVITLPEDSRYTAHTAFAAIPVRYALERGAWREASELVVAPTPYPQAEAITRFGRALGAARVGDLAAAKRDLHRLLALRRQLTEMNEDYWAKQVEIGEEAIMAWIEFREGREHGAIALMRQAADQEDTTAKHIALENRLVPMRELLGELLIEAGEPAIGIEALEAVLKKTPNRYRSIAGIATTASRIGDEVRRQKYEQLLLEIGAAADSDRPELTSARNAEGIPP
jgi:hypothetical protein